MSEKELSQVLRQGKFAKDKMIRGNLPRPSGSKSKGMHSKVATAIGYAHHAESIPRGQK